jgi:nitrogen fixation protein FixH
MSSTESTRGKITGPKVLAIAVGAFAVILTANLSLAVGAIRTFPGLEVQNSYVASQGFNARLADQLALGWDVRVEVEGGYLRVIFTDAAGAPVDVATMEATLGRATHVRDDQTPDFRYEGGIFTAPVDLEPGNWNLRLVAFAPDGTQFQQRISFWLRG